MLYSQFRLIVLCYYCSLLHIVITLICISCKKSESRFFLLFILTFIKETIIKCTCTSSVWHTNTKSCAIKVHYFVGLCTHTLIAAIICTHFFLLGAVVQNMGLKSTDNRVIYQSWAAFCGNIIKLMVYMLSNNVKYCSLIYVCYKL